MQIPVRVENLSFHYNADPRLVLRDISFEVAAGEVLGVLGPSGVGKSTLCYCLKGLIPHVINGTYSGNIWVNGLNTRQVTPANLAEQIGMVFQDPESQIIGLTVEEDLAFGPENMEEEPVTILKRMPGLLDLVGLSGFLQRETYKLSGGQKQRLAIASALMMHPNILILDEPTSELDPLGREEVYQAIYDLKQTGTTIILVDHHIEELLEVTDRLLVFEEGIIVEDTTPHDFFTSTPKSSYGWLRRPQIVQVGELLRQQGLVTDVMSPFEDDFTNQARTMLGLEEES